MKSRKSGIAVLLALAAGGCAWSASPADGLRFAAPLGWRSSPGIMGLMQFWRPPADDREMLMLFKSPRPLQARDVFSTAQFRDTMKHVTVERRRAIRDLRAPAGELCRGARFGRARQRRSYRNGNDNDFGREELLRDIRSPSRGTAQSDGPGGTARALHETVTLGAS